MSEKKRKRYDAIASGRPHKKIAPDTPPQGIKFSVIEGGQEWTPVLGAYTGRSCCSSAIEHSLTSKAYTPGLEPPSGLSLKPYTRPRLNAACHSTFGPELLLYSRDHPKLEYTAREEDSNGSESHLKHYVGVYDPQSGKLQLVQARKLVVRSTLRSATAVPSNDRKDENDMKNTPNACLCVPIYR